MRKYRSLSTALLLVILSIIGSAQEADKKSAGPSTAVDSRLLWKFDTGG